MEKEEILQLMDSWENLGFLSREIDRHPECFDTLMEIALTSNEKGSWRAAWMADKIHDRYPELIRPYLDEMTDSLHNLRDRGKIRHFLKLISMNQIREDHFGFLVDYCLRTLESSEPPANRVHAMQVLYNISEVEKELKPELIQIIEQEIEYRPTPGILTRGKRILKMLHKQAFYPPAPLP